MKTWKRRWFILTDNCLYYFEYTTVSYYAVCQICALCYYIQNEILILSCYKVVNNCIRVMDVNSYVSPAYRTKNRVESFLWRTSASERWRNPENLWVMIFSLKNSWAVQISENPVPTCCFSSCRTVLSCTIQTIKGRWSRRVRQRQMDGWWRGTTSSTGYQHPHQRRKRNGSNPSSKTWAYCILIRRKDLLSLGET